MVRWGRKSKADEPFGTLPDAEEWNGPEYTPPSSDYTGSSEGDQQEQVDPQLEGEAQEVMNDNLELMKEVVLRIQEDDEFARNIYANCPRLQRLLDQHPDIRPLFEDPKFVLINFEKVYRDAGGKLPGDPPEKPSKLEQFKKCLAAITSHPLFKIFKWLMIIKKIIFFFSPTKVFGFVKGCFCPSVDDLDLDIEAPDIELERTKEAINKAADRLEDPEVQDAMEEAIDDPDKLEELIENNKELRELRENNPLCAEMMNDPETFKIISDPDNLRALGDAPELIQADFADPDWVPGDDGGLGADVGADVDAPDVDADGGDMEAEGREADIEEEDWDDEDEISEESYSDESYSDESEEEEEEEEGDNMFEDVEFENEYEPDDDDRQSRQQRARQRERRARSQQARDGEEEEDYEEGEEGKGSRLGYVMGGFIGAGVGAMGGAIFEDMEALFGGGGEEDLGGDLGGAEELAAEEAPSAEAMGGAAGFETLDEGGLGEDDGGLLEQAEVLEDVEYEGEEEEAKDGKGDTDADAGEDSNLAADLGADAFEEFDYEEDDKDKDKDKDKEKEERERREREAAERRARGAGFDDQHSSRGRVSRNTTDDWIRY